MQSKSRQKHSKLVLKRAEKRPEFEPLDFSSIERVANLFAQHIENIFDELVELLLEYESFEVTNDEIARTLDLLRNLKENKDFFVIRAGQVTSFLPRNQPLYALTCFVIVPSLMATEVHFRMPHCMRSFFPRFVKLLNMHSFFPNIFISSKERMDFLLERSALRIDSLNQESLPVTSVVIFTGTSHHAERLRLVFDQRTLVIVNGAGHNPIVVSKDADVKKAVDAALSLQLYNQGQDCASPSAILVHDDIFHSFIFLLRQELQKIKVGFYKDRLCRVGPISEPEDLKRIEGILVDNRIWLDQSTPGIIRAASSIVEPTIISKPLSEGANFNEVFAPIFFIQKYKADEDLSLYFEHPHYARNAMYISLYGTSRYIEQLIDRPIEGKVLHHSDSLLHNIHLHAPGVERGTKPYGGNGYAASSISIHGKLTGKATLPQRDIYEHVVKPLLHHGAIQKRKKILLSAKKIVRKDIPKLLGLKLAEHSTESSPLTICYLDTKNITKKGVRYVSVGAERVFLLLKHSNVEHIAAMEPKHTQQIKMLHSFLAKHKKIQLEQISQLLYTIPKKKNLSEYLNRIHQLELFRNIYQLLFGKDFGPRLGQFLLDADRKHILELLDV